MLASLTRWALILIMLVGLPLAGVALSGQTMRTYLEFPPLTRYVAHAPFNGWVFTFIAALDLLMMTGLLCLFKRARDNAIHVKAMTKHAFPIWGWIGIGIMLSGWLLAWTRLAWFAPLQHHTFCLPWVGYILLANAWCIRRSGSCLLKESPVRFLLLFPASAFFWWFFEFLNRMVQNWYYIGVDTFSPGAYIVFASLAFSTVLPAVLSTQRLLLTLPLFNPGLANGYSLKTPETTPAALLFIVVGVFGLVLMGRFPSHLYPLVWVAPLLLITALQILWRHNTLFTPLSIGDWRTLVAAAVAALVCGFFWELWNVYSLARWEYSIPFVNRFHIFAMPVLGYGGYLPFGLECLLVGRMVMGEGRLDIDR